MQRGASHTPELLYGSEHVTVTWHGCFGTLAADLGGILAPIIRTSELCWWLAMLDIAYLYLASGMLQPPYSRLPETTNPSRTF